MGWERKFYYIVRLDLSSFFMAQSSSSSSAWGQGDGVHEECNKFCFISLKFSLLYIFYFNDGQ